ncbi:hypothetical protein VPH35_058374 [Triticum aestivum]
MAQPPPWKVMYLYVASQARDGCAAVRQRVAAARDDLASPQVALDTRDAEGRYTLLQSATTHLQHASDHLSAFIINTAVAERLALHGCGAVPSQPVARVGDLRAGHDHEWLGLIRLQAAKGARQGCAPPSGGGPRPPGLRPVHASQPEPRRQLHALDLQPVVVGVASMSALASFATEHAIGDRIQ